VIAQLAIAASLLATALMIASAPLSLLLMCLTLRLLGASKNEVLDRALKFTDQWINEGGGRRCIDRQHRD
jgi:hypothetical protein